MTKAEYLRFAMQFYGVQFDLKVAEIVWKLVPIINQKGGKTDILDLCKIMVDIEDDKVQKQVIANSITNYDLSDESMNTSIHDYDFNDKAIRCFKILGINTIRDIYSYSPKTFLNIHGVGKMTISLIQKVLKENGFPILD